MKILDYTGDVKNLVLSGLAAVDRLLPRFEGPRRERNEYLDDTAPDLVSLLTELYHLRRFARLGAPHIADFGGFGTGLDDSDAPTIMSVVDGKESWDFQPWLAEKLQSAEQLAFRVCDICTHGCDSPERPRWRRVGPYADMGAECYHLLEGVRAYLSKMLGLMESGELKIHQLSADNDVDSPDQDE